VLIGRQLLVDEVVDDIVPGVTYRLCGVDHPVESVHVLRNLAAPCFCVVQIHLHLILELVKAIHAPREGDLLRTNLEVQLEEAFLKGLVFCVICLH
jgi:hypothetical protein